MADGNNTKRMADKGGFPDIADTQPDRLIKCRVSDDGFEAEMLLPGLWYTDFDKKIGGKLSYWSISNINEALRVVGHIHGFGHSATLLQGGNQSLFLVSASYHLSEKFQNIRYKTHFGVHFPLRAKLWVSSVGRSSICVAITVQDISGTCLMEHVAKAVLLDAHARKPVPLPSMIHEQFEKSKKPAPHYDISKVRPPNIPSTSYELTFTVLPSDCDINFHANQVSFIQWCSDAAAEAATAGCFSHFKKHPELYPLKFSEMHYLGEALANTAVTASVWEDAKGPRCLRATVSSKGKVIFHTVLEYYDGPPVLVEPHLESKL